MLNDISNIFKWVCIFWVGIFCIFFAFFFDNSNLFKAKTTISMHDGWMDRLQFAKCRFANLNKEQKEMA